MYYQNEITDTFQDTGYIFKDILSKRGISFLQLAVKKMADDLVNIDNELTNVQGIYINDGTSKQDMIEAFTNNITSYSTFMDTV